MAQGRREQARFAMLPHIGGKFDVARFIRTGHVQEWINGGEVPDTPAMRKAIADLEREQEERRKKGLIHD